MSIQQTQALAETIHDLGYESVDAFALEKAKEALQEEINTCQKQIEEFEQKYAMNLQTFIENFDSITQFGLFEKEDDEMEWRAWSIAINSVKDKLKVLRQ